ncbi:hypothetical protein BGZ76_010949, partial [Entomortierella beljakovae]
MTRALEIFEIRLHLAKFLTLSQLSACALVCREWNDSFTPILYSYIFNRKDENTSTVQTLEKHSKHVRSLIFENTDTTSFYSLPYGFIERLFITIEPKARAPPTGTLARLILENQNTLQDVYFQLKYLGQLDSLWTSLSQCKRISKVRIKHMSIKPNYLLPFISTCSKITELTIEHCVNNMDYDQFVQAIQPLAPFSNLTRLTFDSSGPKSMEKIIIELIKISPNLKELYWIPLGTVLNSLLYTDMLNEFRIAMTCTVYKNLERLTLGGKIYDYDTSLALNAMTNAIQVVLIHALFKELSYIALMENHANTIQHLVIICGITSTMVQGILSGCPSLEIFEARYIEGADLARVVPSRNGEPETIVLSQDWVCLQLRSLKLTFSMIGDTTIDQSTPEGAALFQRQQKLEQVHAFRQLSRLHALESLRLEKKYTEVDCDQTLNMRLRSQ